MNATNISIALALALAVFCAADARAQSSSSTAAADALFAEGLALRKKGEHTKACDRFLRSQSLDPARGTLQNIGLCMEKQGKLASAQTAFQNLLDQSLGAGDKERVRFAKKKLQKLKARVPSLLIVVGDEVQVEGLKVSLNQAPVPRAMWNLRAPVDPGPYTITVTAPKHESWTTQVDLRERQAKEIVVARLATSLVAPVEKKTPDSAVVSAKGGATSELVKARSVDDKNTKDEARTPRLRGALYGGGIFGLEKHEEGLVPSFSGQLALQIIDGPTIVHLGVEGTFAALGWKQGMSSGSTRLLGALLTLSGTRTLVSKLQFHAQVGAGILVLTGLEDPAHPLVDPSQEVDGAIALLNLSASLGLSYEFAENLRLLLDPVVVHASPSRSGMAKDISNLRTIQFMAGLSSSF